ncbi:Serine protease hepsin [Holothuria leucospilota]|uniref:Serine protease hepsin n=1 Tax=Holothuria leucospilota TaxID=206669 RepID=A0A9Q1CFG6_HOLLE|nr:Serine protease hepsin [Holothuria leucospilota]
MYEPFDPLSLWHDVAVVELRTPVAVFTERIFPACLDNNIVNVTDEDLLCYATGWGVTHSGRQASTLQEARLPIIERAQCDHEDVYLNSIEDDMFCAGFLEGKVDACKQGDSGGPFACQHYDGLWYLVGLTSWGEGCALPNRPGVYTNVSHYYLWVTHIVEHFSHQYNP